MPSLQELFSGLGPSEAQAGVLPDPEIKALMAEMLREGGMPASTLRVAMNFPNYVQVTRSKDLWDRYVNDLMSNFSDEKIRELGHKNRESLRQTLLGRIAGKYYSQDPGDMTPEEQLAAWRVEHTPEGEIVTSHNYGSFPIAMVSPYPPKFENALDPKKIIAHELGHFLVDATGFAGILKDKGIDEETFANFLGGLPVAAPEKLRPVASELFRRALKIQQKELSPPHSLPQTSDQERRLQTDEETQLLIDEFPALAGDIMAAAGAGKTAGEIADSIALRVKKFLAFTPGATKDDAARLLRTGNPAETGVDIPATAPSPSLAVVPPTPSPQPTTSPFEGAPQARGLGAALRRQAGEVGGETSVAELLERGTGRLGRSFTRPTELLIEEIGKAVSQLPEALMTAPRFIGRGMGDVIEAFRRRQEQPVSELPYLGLTPLEPGEPKL